MSDNNIPESNGFSLVEILIGVVILSLAIMTLSAALRHAFHWQQKQYVYQNLYITASSLLNEMMSEQVNEAPEQESFTTGHLNDFEYKRNCKPFLVNRNSNFSIETPGKGSNNGFFTVVLQQCTLVLQGSGKKRQFVFYRTQYCCPLDAEDAP